MAATKLSQGVDKRGQRLTFRPRARGLGKGNVSSGLHVQNQRICRRQSVNGELRDAGRSESRANFGPDVVVVFEVLVDFALFHVC